MDIQRLVRHLQHRTHVMACNENGLLSFEVVQYRIYIPRRIDVKACVRLIQRNDAALDASALAITARLSCPLESWPMPRFSYLTGPPARWPKMPPVSARQYSVETAYFSYQCTHQHEFSYRKRKSDIEFHVLRHIANPPPFRSPDRALIRSEQPRQQFDQRALTSTVWPDKRRHRSRG